jgi:hypothetical protein
MPRTRTRRTRSARLTPSAPPAREHHRQEAEQRGRDASRKRHEEENLIHLYSREWELAPDSLAELLELALYRRHK